MSPDDAMIFCRWSPAGGFYTVSQNGWVLVLLCFFFLIFPFECSLWLLCIHLPIFSVKWCSMLFLRTTFYWFAFFIMKTPSCCWLLQHPSVSPWLTVKSFLRTILDHSLLLVWVQLYFPNKCIIQIHPLWRLSVIIPVVLPWTFLYFLPSNVNLQTSHLVMSLWVPVISSGRLPYDCLL